MKINLYKNDEVQLKTDSSWPQYLTYKVLLENSWTVIVVVTASVKEDERGG
jgi:hypothetical protein